MKRRLLMAGLLCLGSAIAHAGIGDDLNTAIKGLNNLQFTPMKGRVMSCMGVYGDTGFVHTIYFMDGIEEGRIIARLNKGSLDTGIMNKVARKYGEWKHVRTDGKIKYFYCSYRGGIWSHYNTVGGYPSWFVYSEKIAQTLNGTKEQGQAAFAPDQDL